MKFCITQWLPNSNLNTTCVSSITYAIFRYVTPPTCFNITNYTQKALVPKTNMTSVPISVALTTREVFVTAIPLILMTIFNVILTYYLHQHHKNWTSIRTNSSRGSMRNEAIERKITVMVSLFKGNDNPKSSFFLGLLEDI